MQVQEDVDTRTIMANFVRAQNRVKRVEEDLAKSELSAQKDVKKANDKFAKTFAKLVRVHEDVVKPMVEEMVAFQKEAAHYKTNYYKNLKDL